MAGCWRQILIASVRICLERSDLPPVLHWSELELLTAMDSRCTALKQEANGSLGVIFGTTHLPMVRAG